MKVSYWHTLSDGRIQCDLCPRFCKLREGQRGLCFVRMRQNDHMVLDTYGRSTGFCIDPIEKKPLNHYLPGTSTLSFGTAGCNLVCKFCQNWHISKSRATHDLTDRASPEQIARTAHQQGCHSVSYTYNDPIIFMEYAIDIAQACRPLNVQSVAVTAGYIQPKPAEQFFKHMDAANVDLKAFTESFYYRLTGSHLQPILDLLQYLVHETDVWVELTTLLIPEENDSDAELHAMTQWIAEKLNTDIPIHFSAFHPTWKLKHRPRTPLSTLLKARQIAKENGLKYVYTGNVQDIKSSSTFCHHCQTPLIARQGWQIQGWNLTRKGLCKRCGTPCSGVWNRQPGQWNAQRVPIRIN
ncbi:AmmeMemoRadiSam system radical SAM enzyme [Magnetococcales bacterium HHB-1]